MHLRGACLSVRLCLCDRGIVPKSEEKKFLAEMDELNKDKLQLEDALVDEEEAEKEGVDPETVHTHHADVPMSDPYPTFCDSILYALGMI